MVSHLEDNGIVRYLPWSPYAEDIKAVESFHKYQESYAGIEYYGKTGDLQGYRGDVAYFITPKREDVIGLKCINVNDSKPLNSTNEGYDFSANLGKVCFDYWGIEWENES